MAAFHSATRPSIKLAYTTVAVALALLSFWVFEVKVFSSTKVEDPPVQVKQPVLNVPRPQLNSAEPLMLKSEVTPPPQVQLSGTVGGVDGQRLAVVSVNKSPEIIVRVGDTIFAASTVTEIRQDSMTFRHGSNLIRVVMQDRPASPKGIASSTQASTNELQVATKENTVSGLMANTGTAGLQSSGESKNGNADFRQAFEKKMNSFQQRP